MELPIVLALAIVAIVVAVVGRLQVRERERWLRLFARRLDGGEFHERFGETRFWRRRVTGRYQGASVEVATRNERRGRRSDEVVTYLRVSLKVVRCVASPFSVSRPTLQHRFEQLVGRAPDGLGSERLDGKFQVRSGSRIAVATRLRRSRRFERDLDGLLRAFRFDQLTLTERGRLEATKELEHHDVSPERLERVLQHLTRVAADLQGREVAVSQDGVTRRAVALTASTAGLLCPYCRDDLAADGLELVTCDRCTTLHHRICFEEIQQCTVFGCGATQAHPARPATPEAFAARRPPPKPAARTRLRRPPGVPGGPRRRARRA